MSSWLPFNGVAILPWVLVWCAGAVRADTEAVASAGVFTDYVQRGVSQNSGQPALQASAGFRSLRGWYAHLWATTLNTSELAPDFGDDAGVEVSAMLGLARAFSPSWVWEANLAHYESFGTEQILDYDYTELQASLSYNERVRLSTSYSPDATDHTRESAKLQGNRWTVDLATQWPITAAIAVTAGGGYNDSREVSDVAYLYWSAGISYRRGLWSLALTAYGTDDSARDRFEDGRADARLVFYLVRSFRF